jgi:hypothetical protein
MTAVSSPESRRIRLISDGVVASYIHDISARPSPAARRRLAGHPPATTRSRRRLGSLAPSTNAPLAATSSR